MSKDGPYVQVACFCETTIEDKSGVISLVRIIDTVTHTVGGPNPPDDMPPLSFRMRLVLMLKAGMARGRHELRMVPELPNGETKESRTWSVHLEGEERGTNSIVDLSFVFEYEGIYWFSIYVDDEKITSIPFRVKYNRVVTTPGQNTRPNH